MIVCPFCRRPIDHAGRCSNQGCFMWFTLVPLPEFKEVEYEVRNACGEIVFQA